MSNETGFRLSFPTSLQGSIDGSMTEKIEDVELGELGAPRYRPSGNSEQQNGSNSMNDILMGHAGVMGAEAVKGVSNLLAHVSVMPLLP